ncbi:MAG: OmpH family outer membrane protein [Alkalilacustris sp.]
MLGLLPILPSGLGLAASSAQAQIPGTRFTLGEAPAVVTVDQERLFAQSGFGQAVEAEVERAARALAEENRRLERALAQEEQDLTERRAELGPEEFRPLADAFGARVEAVRRTQEARGRAIGAFRDTQRQRFFEAALPVITEVVVARGAVAVLDSRAIIMALEQIDITDGVLERVDAVIGASDVPAIAAGPSAADAPSAVLPMPPGPSAAPSAPAQPLPDASAPPAARAPDRPTAPPDGVEPVIPPSPDAAPRTLPDPRPQARPSTGTAPPLSLPSPSAPPD